MTRFLVRHQLQLAPAALVLAALGGCGEEPISASDAASMQVATPLATTAPDPTPARQVTPAATPAPSTPAVDGPVVLALGDSVTFGVGVADPAEQAFPALVADALEAEARVLAVPGETANGFLERRVDDVEAAVAELGTRIEAVTIGLGANEILRIRRDPACRENRGAPECQLLASDAAEGAASALDAVVGRTTSALERAGSTAPILVLAYYNPDVDPIAASTIVGADGVVDCAPDDPAPGLNDRIACVAERREALLVDLYVAFLGREDELTGISHGDVHPTVAGHEVIADAILRVLEKRGD